jgi:hypothetical protein
MYDTRRVPYPQIQRDMAEKFGEDADANFAENDATAASGIAARDHGSGRESTAGVPYSVACAEPWRRRRAACHTLATAICLTS